MNKTFWKKAGMGAGCVILGAYVLFLASPLIVNPIINNYSYNIVKEIKELTGLNAGLGKIHFVTTPKLTAGVKVENFSLQTPNNEPILSTDGFQVKMSLLPLIARKIEVDTVQLNSIDANIKMNRKGELDLLKYFPEQTSEAEKLEPSEAFSLPFGLKLSNHLPDIHVKKHNITLTDGIQNYTISGSNIDITDFILDKSIKINTSGKCTLQDREQFNYNLKILNKIMPEMDLNELVFNPEPQEVKQEEAAPVDVIGILEGIYKSNLRANADADLKIEHDGMKGFANVSNLSILELPASSVNVKFKGNSIDILSDIYTAKDEVSNINGLIKTGKSPAIELNFKSKSELANIIHIINKVAVIFGVNDLQTLKANGKIDADFSIKSNMKNLKSNGYFKIPSANVFYGLYNIGIDNINADVTLVNNNIDIKQIGFSILNQPLKFYGTITETAEADLHLTANNLSLKGLIVAAGQSALLKDNNVNSGTVSMNADIKGRLDKISPIVKINLNNIGIKNVPANITLKAPQSAVDITSDGKTFCGSANASNIMLINPAASVSIPKVQANIKENEIEITPTPITIDKIKTTVSGKIKNYLTEKISLHFLTVGDIKSTLSGDLNVNKQSLNLNYATNEASTIIVPMFDKSKLTFNCNIAILGSMVNPTLKGAINVPTVEIPEIPVSLKNIDIKLNGPILAGSATATNFASGGIKAENIVTDFSMKGENFYLKNLKGTAFDGKIAGNIVYNMANAKTSIDFSGSNMNAQKAAEGAVGIKNALTGVLGFKTKLSLKAVDYDEMMRSLKGNLTFEVKNGAFGSIGRIENMLSANNIVNNAILKTTVNTITKSIGLADTAKFEYINGNLSFLNGWADLKSIKSSGPVLAYYVAGKYNLLNGTTNVTILGRMDAQVVAKLGPIGEFSADKLLRQIPKFGNLTANIANALTTNPKGENVAAIPVLTTGSKNYKDFKVLFNGGLESTSSVKSFKWLTDIDMSAIETKSTAETIKDIKKAVNEDFSNTVQSVTDIIKNSKEEFNATKDQIKNSADEILKLFKK